MIKNFLSFLISLLSMTALLAQVRHEAKSELLNNSATETTFKFSLQGVDFKEVTTPRGHAKIPFFGNGTPLLEAGSPDVPKWATALQIPGTGEMSVEIVASEFEDFPGIEIAPSKGDLKRNVDPATVPFEFGAAFERDEFFPGKLADLQKPFIFRSVRGQAIWVFPVQYNPKTKVLRVYSEMTVRVFKSSEKGDNELTVNDLPQNSRTFEGIFRATFLNYESQEETRGGNAEIEKMLVIAADHLIPTLEPLLVWKRQSGISVELVPTSELSSPEAANIYNLVKDRYLASGITYLMLVGDAAAINPEMRQDGGWYSCDNCFGYMAGNDHFPEILVGRLNAETPEQLKIIVNRNLEYEKSPLVDAAQNWYSTAMASTSDQGAGIGDDGQADYEQGNEWKSKHLADGFEKIWEFYDGSHANISPTPGDATADKTGNPVSADLLNLLNGRGASLYNYTGHGWEQGLVSGNFDVAAVSNLKNSGRYPVIIAVACCAGHFTYAGGDCLGERVQRAGNLQNGQPYGSIAGFFSSDYQTWSPPMEGQDGMNQYLLDADGINLTPTMSAMLATGNAKMIAAYAAGGELMADFWNPFTEPSTMPRTRLPQEIQASHSANLNIGANQIEVNCAVEGALVTVFWQGEPIGVAVVAGGVAVVSFPSLANVGDLTVTITQFNHVPYQNSVVVTPASGPFVVSQSIVLDDSAAGQDNDGKADFGETVNLNLKLANVGLVPATAVKMVLSTSSPGITILDNEQIFGEIEDSTFVETPAAFKFLVANNVADGQNVLFNLKLTFSDSMGYDIALPVKLQAPKLAAGSLTVDDSGSGNNNGRLDGGETVFVRVKNFNTGLSQSPAAVGTLTSNSPWLTISPAFNLGKLSAQTGEAEAVFTVKVSANAPQSQSFRFDYQVVAGAYSASGVFPDLLLNAIVEDFETQNFAAYPWQMTGNKPWVITSVGTYAGNFCSRSGAITHTQKSAMNLTLNVLQDSKISFARKVSSEENYDYLHFILDAQIMESWSGQLDWEEVSFPVSAGEHTLTWIYEKDQYGSEGTDKAWVDDVVLPPHELIVSSNELKINAFGLNVFPNPVSGEAFARFEIDGSREISLEILDCFGRQARSVLQDSRLNSGEQVLGLDFHGLAEGVYFVRLKNEKGQAAVKVVKL